MNGPMTIMMGAMLVVGVGAGLWVKLRGRIKRGRQRKP